MIKSYDYKPEPEFLMLKKENRQKNLFFGIELEVEMKKDNDRQEVAEKILASDTFIFYLKNDNSLNNGFEVVSHPATLKYHQKNFGWKKLLDDLSKLTLSHNTKTCGLHIHINKDYFTQNEMVKIGIFINTNEIKISAISRRTSTEYAKFKYIDLKYLKDANKNDGDRYEAINWLNHDTIEFRTFRGTLKYNTFMATIEFIDSVANFIKKTSTKKIADVCNAWSLYKDFIKNKKEYKRLNNYLKSKGV